MQVNTIPWGKILSSHAYQRHSKGFAIDFSSPMVSLVSNYWDTSLCVNFFKPIKNTHVHITHYSYQSDNVLSNPWHWTLAARTNLLSSGVHYTEILLYFAITQNLKTYISTVGFWYVFGCALNDSYNEKMLQLNGFGFIIDIESWDFLKTKLIYSDIIGWFCISLIFWVDIEVASLHKYKVAQRK